MELMVPKEFSDFLTLLISHKVDFMVVGGFAVSHHGYSRPTNDLDVWIRVAPKNAEKVVAAIREFGFDVPALNTDLFLVEGKITRMGYPPVRIEILTKPSGVEFDACFANASDMNIGALSVPVISLSDLRQNKLAAGRHKDLADLEHLPKPN